MTSPILPPMSFDVSRVHFPGIFDAEHIPGSDPEGLQRYGVAVPWEDLDEVEVVRDVLAAPILKARSSLWGLVNLRSARRPRVYAASGKVQDLIDLWAVADAGNVSRDSLFIGLPMTLHVCFWEKTRGANRGDIGVSLNAITVDTAAISIPGPLDELPSFKD